MNENIKAKEIRLVGETDSLIIPTTEALALAREKDMDLVMISPNANPPVCKIINYSKFLYEQSKKEKENKKNQKTVDIKEIRLSPSIEEHDINVKVTKREGIHTQIQIKDIFGNSKWLLIRGKGILDNNKKLKLISGIVLDITSMKEQEKYIEHIAYHDSLTNLPNRRRLIKKQRII